MELSRSHSVLLLQVVERNGDDFIIEAHVSVRQFSAIAACNVSLDALRSWRAELDGMHQSLEGEAQLHQEGISLTMRAGDHGRVTLHGTFHNETSWDDGERAVLRFSLPPLDQTDLPGIIDMLGVAIAMPQRHEDF